MTEAALHVFDCPKCGAPLPPSVLDARVTCTFCGEQTTTESNGPAMRREQESRREAEALFAVLGRGPTWSQRVAAFLVKPKLWLFGFPVLLYFLMRVSRAPQSVVERWWETHHHERLSHVLSPVAGLLFNIGFSATIAIAVLVWSLFGERVDARRDLQAALACKPPETAGGRGRCRSCDAPLDVDKGALGVRCSFCGADNLVKIPFAWAARATKLEIDLRLRTETAREREITSHRRVRKAAMWRIPFVLAILGLVGFLSLRLREAAGWESLRFHSENRVGLDKVVVRRDHADPTHVLHTYTACEDAQARQASFADAQLSAAASEWCDPESCTLAVMFALSRGDSLRLDWQEPGATRVRFALAPTEYLGSDLVLWDGFGDPVFERDVALGSSRLEPLEIPVPVSGWYKLDLRAAPGVTVEPCILPAPTSL